mgnify:CR=1 FL=1
MNSISSSFEPLIGNADDINLNGIDWVIVGGESGPAPQTLSLPGRQANYRHSCRMHQNPRSEPGMIKK